MMHYYTYLSAAGISTIFRHFSVLVGDFKMSNYYTSMDYEAQKQYTSKLTTDDGSMPATGYSVDS